MFTTSFLFKELASADRFLRAWLWIAWNYNTQRTRKYTSERETGLHRFTHPSNPITTTHRAGPIRIFIAFFITKLEHHFLIGPVKALAQISFLEAWGIHKTFLKSSFRNRGDKNQPSKFIQLGISRSVYYTHFDSCSKTAIQCKQLTGWNFSLRT